MGFGYFFCTIHSQHVFKVEYLKYKISSLYLIKIIQVEKISNKSLQPVAIKNEYTLNTVISILTSNSIIMINKQYKSNKNFQQKHIFILEVNKASQVIFLNNKCLSTNRFSQKSILPSIFCLLLFSSLLTFLTFNLIL